MVLYTTDSYGLNYFKLLLLYHYIFHIFNPILTIFASKWGFKGSLNSFCIFKIRTDLNLDQSRKNNDGCMYIANVFRRKCPYLEKSHAGDLTNCTLGFLRHHIEIPHGWLLGYSNFELNFQGHTVSPHT